MKSKLNIGVVGVGHLGSIHLKCLELSDRYDIVGLYDVDEHRAADIGASHGVKAYDDLDALIADVDVIDVVTPTPYHHEVASRAIKAGKHVFIEKPVTSTLEEARSLKQLREEHGVRVQIGHVERFNPAILALDGYDIRPGFIEGHRLAQFNPRGNDVSVVLDLMIHDLDLILKMVPSEVVDIQSKCVAVVSHVDDICNARLTFANDCVVNLTASRISLKNMRKLRLFQEDAYISIDMLEKQTQIISLSEAQDGTDPDELLDTPRGPRTINMKLPTIRPVNAILMELDTFYDCIKEDRSPYVSLSDGVSALELAYKIMEKAHA